jgi:hypothetical protein
MATWTLLARAADRSIAGILRGYSLALTLRWNEVGSWSLNLPRESAPAGWPAPGTGLIMMRDGQVVASGNWDEQTFTWSADPGDQDAGQGRYTLTGDTDLARLAYRTVYPDYLHAWTAQGNAYYADSGIGESVLRNLVNRQAGSNALTARIVPGLHLGTAVGVGDTISIRERFTPLLEAMRSAAESSGGLAFDVRDNLAGTQEFVVWQPVDRTDTARFGVELGNVASLEIRRTSPVATTALVAGTEELAARQTLEKSDDDAVTLWGRRELFVDQRQATDEDWVPGDPPTAEQLAEYEKAADEALADQGEQFAVAAVTIDTPQLQWGRDYTLGDKVSVITPFGPVDDLVRQVDIAVEDTGVEDIRSTIGTNDISADDPLATTVRRLTSRISQIERAL